MQASSTAKKKPAVGATHVGRTENVEDPDDDPEMYSNIDDQCVSYRPPDYRGFNPNSKAPPGDKTAACGEPIYGNSIDDYEDPGNTCTDNKMASESDEYYEVVDFQQRVSPIKEVAVTLETGPPTTGGPGACAPATRNEGTKGGAAFVTSGKKNKQRAAFLCSPRMLTAIILLLLLIIAILLGAVVYLETDTDECSSAPCGVGGGCIEAEDGFLCVCFPGYSGSQCQTDIYECTSSPCMNGGKCSDFVNSFKCTCEAGYNGTLCEADISECANNPCKNEAQCNAFVDSFNCTCLAGYNGPLCETDFDDCVSGPCQNGGECKDGVNSFNCTCAAGFTGYVCENHAQYYCGFESSTCDLLQDIYDDFDWTRNDGNTGGGATGPTSGFRGSFYIYIECTGPGPGQTARISTPRLYGGHTWCVMFAYHMYGTGIGTLILYIEDQSRRRTTWWIRNGNVGNRWIIERRSVKIQEGDKIGWEGVHGDSNLGDIALDDAKVTLGACT